jgi:hypothetical protein
MESVYTFFSVSIKNHHKFADVQAELGLKHSELVQLSETRWSCQIRSVIAMIANLSAVIQCLSDVNSPTAVGLHAKLCKLSTVYLLFTFESLLSTTAGFHKVLQQEDLNLAKAIDFKDAVCTTLQGMRTTDKGQELYDKAVELCTANNIDIATQPAPKRKQRRMDDFVVESTVGFREETNTSDKLKRTLLYPCLDRMLTELNQRFSTVDKGLIIGIQACNPLSDNFLSVKDLTVLAEYYGVSLKPEEALGATNYVSTKQKTETISTTQDVYHLLDPQMFPSLKVVLQVALTIPVSSCSCERSFSMLRRLQTWLRCIMTQSRLRDLAVMTIEKDVLNSLAENTIIDGFLKKSSRRQ